MTRRSSLRAQARKIYREMASQTPLIPANAGIQSDPARPVNGAPRSPSQVGYSRLAHISWQTSGIPDVCARGRTEESLTEKARALYENSAVPVAEIARLTGVTERTIYKYAAKGRWTPRYRWSAAHPRRWRAGQRFAPAKGAGARFIRRADKGKPIATGLKATDPAGAARAGVSCGQAGRWSRQAQRQAQHEAEAIRRSDALIHAIGSSHSALRNLREFHHSRDQAKPGPFDSRAEDILLRIATMALAQWQALVAEEERARRTAAAPSTGPRARLIPPPRGASLPSGGASGI